MARERQVRRVDYYHPSSEAVELAAAALRDGGVVLLPSDTTYVLATVVRAGNSPSPGIDLLFEAKNRSRRLTFPWLVASPSDLDVYGTDVSDEAFLLAEGSWPSGLSIVVNASSAVPRRLARYDGTVSLRMSASPVVAAVLHACGRPLVATGANVHDADPVLSVEAIDPEVVTIADVVLDAGADVCLGSSTIVDCSEGEATLIREGCVPLDRVESVLGFRPAPSN